VDSDKTKLQQLLDVWPGVLWAAFWTCFTIAVCIGMFQ